MVSKLFNVDKAFVLVLQKENYCLKRDKYVIYEEYNKHSSFPLAFPVIWGRRYGC